MSTQLAPESATATRLKIIDCDIHPLLRNPSDIRAYLSPVWHEHFDVYGNGLRQPFAAGDLYPKAAPYISRRDAWPPAGGPPGSDLEFMRQQHLDPMNVEFGILQVLAPTGANQRNLDFGAALCSAVNDWQIAEWMDPEPRLRGSLTVPQDFPEAAVAEIRRHGQSGKFAQVSVTQRTLEPIGRRRFWPIFAAAVEHGLPLGIHSGGNAGHPIVPGGGWGSFYAEQHQAIGFAMQAIVTSLVMEGVFEEFPELKVVLIEGGFGWLPALTWRLDRLWTRMRSEVPRLRRLPSEYVHDHIWLTTQPMDETEKPKQLRQLFDWVGWDRLLFSSDYPHWDQDDPRWAFPFQMSEAERRQLFRGNAAALFGLGEG